MARDATQRGGGDAGLPTAGRGGLSIRAREVIIVTLLTLLVVVVTTFILLHHSRQIVWEASLREGELVARQIYAQSAHVLSRNSDRDPWTVIQSDRELRSLLEASVGYAPGLLYALIADEDGRAVLHSDRTREGERVPEQPNLRTLMSQNILQRAQLLYHGPQIYEVKLPFDLGGKPFATIRLGIGVPLVRRQLEDSLRSSIALGVLALVAALAVAIVLSSLTLKPIRKLAEDMERLRQGDFDVGSGEGPKDEFGKLAFQLQLLGRQIQSDRTRILAERSQLQSAVDQLEDGIMFFNLEGRVLFANRAVEVALGRPASEVVGARLDGVLGADHPLRQMVQQAFEHGASLRNVVMEIPAEGSPAEFLVSVFPLVDEGKGCDGAILVLRDMKSVAVSARTFQSLIQYSAQLAALGQVTSEVTHDVKNPLQAMAVHVAYLKEKLSDPPAEVRRSLSVLEAEIRRVDIVVERFMELIRPTDVSMKPVDLNVLLQDATTLLDAEWQAKGVTFALQFERGLPRMLGDEALLRRAFMNILVNACQAMPDGGRVTITSEREGDGLAKVTVSDTGVGIPPEDLERIFNRYYTTKAGGSGIGLPLVRRVVEMHDGDIEMLSAVGDGTSVIVRLPLSAAP